MWPDIVSHLPSFSSAVLTGVDQDGYPFSVRCRPCIEHETQALLVELPEGCPIQPGPAGLLCHRHDEHLWNQRSFLARGTLERTGEGWRFRARRFTPGLGIGGLRAQVRFVIEARRAAGNYLARRSLPRPRIPWREIDAVKAQAKRSV